MTPRRRPELQLSRAAYDELAKLPGNARRLLISTIDGLQKNPRPHNSKLLILAGTTTEIRRLRLGRWRILYLIIDEQPLVLAIRIRPPYNYEDLQLLIDLSKK